MEPQEKLVKIAVPLDDEVDTIKYELVWATDIGLDKFQIDNCLVYAYGLSVGDIVKAFKNDTGSFVVKEVTEKSGNRTIRVHFIAEDEDKAKELTERLITQIKSIGCDFERMGEYYFSINILRNTDPTKLIAFLNENAVNWEVADPKQNI